MLKREVIATLLFKLYPDGGWGVDDSTDSFSKIYWNTITPPITEQEFLAGYEQAEKDYELQQTLQKRQLSYPPIGDQLDDLFKAGLFSDSMAAKIQAIKDQYPKN